MSMSYTPTAKLLHDTEIVILYMVARVRSARLIQCVHMYKAVTFSLSSI